ncbi:MAG: 16S rRNA (adenine(1518)-N(6)/adenine(1519)-N(6))-dimethyltransferase RsmA [Oscillospiraceae bacterium]|nr:16S rRNA (adenine(1518)-N(6)/adenine(1519)-N(6))-dimethyltransferase RsmA [Oscillospiraceae bacterium]
MSKSIKGILDSHGFKFSKSMGQNFLIDANIPEKIVRLAEIDKSCGVLEIGPGIGALTAYLCMAAGRVTAVELDEKVLPMLAAELEGFDNVEIISGDILKTDIEKMVNNTLVGLKPCVCANLPYNITSPVITRLIDANIFDSITVMVQKEVALRMCAEPGSSDYGAFSVYINYHTEPAILFDVPPECFMPRPKVTSAVVQMKLRKERILPPKEEAMFFRVVKAAFAQRRKTLVNALHSAFGSKMGKDEITEIVAACGFAPLVRGETLGIGEFVKLSNHFLDKS